MIYQKQLYSVSLYTTTFDHWKR